MIKTKVASFERIEWVDVGKGMTLLLVILGHLLTSGTALSIWIFSFHIPLFFFLSGYVSKIASRSVAKSLRKILINVILPYFIFVAIGLVVSLVIPAWRPSSLETILFDVFYNVQPESLHVGQIWFLFCLAVVQALFVLLMKINFKNRPLIVISICSFALISFMLQTFNVGVWYKGDFFRLPWKIDSAFMGLFFFSLGYYLRSLKLFSKFLSSVTFRKVVFVAIMLIVSVVVSIKLNSGPQLKNSVNLGGNYYGNLIYFMLASLSGITFVVYVSKLLEKNFVLSYMGRNALPIFSSHSFFLYLYAFLLTFFLHKNFIIMSNISLSLSLLGLFMTSSLSLLVPVIYNNTVKKIIAKIN